MPGLHARLPKLLGLNEPHKMPQAATFLLPEGQGPFPAVLYAHAHGGVYDRGRRELTQGARCLATPYAPDLLAAGYAVLCVDMPGHGDRQSEGTESALAKAGLWHGKPLFGQMVADQLAAFDWLAAHPKVDARRIATLGISMGGALAMWTAALQRQVCACVQLCMLADMAPLIALGGHDRHGIYLTVPGLLPEAEIGDIAALIAPRPQFIAHGGDDALTPPLARDAALTRVRAGYRAAASALETHFSAETGHFETPQMRGAVLAFLKQALAPLPTEVKDPC